MGLAMYVLQTLSAHLGIHPGGTQAAVPKHVLDVADIRAIVQHMGRHGVVSQTADRR